MEICDLSIRRLRIFLYKKKLNTVFAHLVRLYKNWGTFDSFHNLWGFYVYEKHTI